MRVSRKGYTGATANSKGIIDGSGNAPEAGRNSYSYGRLRFKQANCNVSAVTMHRRIMPGWSSFSDILRAMDNRTFKDAGGTPGGLGHFVMGFIMTCIGGYLLINQVTVVGSFWSFYGESTFGITLLPMLFGIGLIFWRGRSILGWVLTIGGALFIFAGILANLHIFFRPTSLFNTIVILVLFVGGLGFIARGVGPHGQQPGD